MAEKTSLDDALAVLRAAGARFAYLHGSQADGTAGADSDIDVAAFFARRDIVKSDVLLPDDVDVMVLDTAPLELAGRVAVSGTLLFETDPAERVRWEATTRKIYFDERPRMERAHREFIGALAHG